MILHAAPACKIWTPYLPVATNYYLLSSKHHVCCPFKAKEKEKKQLTTSSKIYSTDDAVKDSGPSPFAPPKHHGCTCIPKDMQQFWVQRGPKGHLKPDFFLLVRVGATSEMQQRGRIWGLDPFFVLVFFFFVGSLCFGIPEIFKIF